MNKICASVLMLTLASTYAYAEQTCSIGNTCDMANAPITFILESGKKYTCHLELIKRSLTTRYFLIGNDKLIASDVYNLSDSSKPPVTKKDITVDTSTSDFGSGYNAIMFIGWDNNNRVWGYETVTCSLQN